MQERNIAGTVHIDLKIDLKGALILGGVVYFAARAGTRKALKKSPGMVQNFFTSVAEDVTEKTKKAWNDADPKGPIIPQQPTGE